MKLPWSKKDEDLYLPAPTVTQLDRPEPEDEGDEWLEPRDELVQRLAQQYRDTPRPLGRLPWTRTPPSTPGLYWWRPHPLGDLPDDMAVHEVVVDFGGRMCVVTKKADAVMYSGVSGLCREWAGPIGVPQGMDLEKWWGIKP
jgi:hypothetical protein